jgi:hypothetical protein
MTYASWPRTPADNNFARSASLPTVFNIYVHTDLQSVRYLILLPAIVVNSPSNKLRFRQTGEQREYRPGVIRITKFNGMRLGVGRALGQYVPTHMVYGHTPSADLHSDPRGQSNNYTHRV